MADVGKIVWLNKGHSFWDQTLLKDLTDGLPESERKLVIVPGTINTPEEVNEEVAKHPKVLVIITSDEENKFDVSQLTHPDMITYVSYPSLPKHEKVNRFWPIGYTQMDVEIDKKKLPWFFAGQVNHPSRDKLAEVLRGMSLGKLVESGGFGQGLDKKEYLQNMVWANTVPAPGGPHSPDSFRLYEAMECGAIPIPDNPAFWLMLFGEMPLFPAVDDWSKLPDLVNNLKDRPEVNNRVMAWWMRYKRQLRYNLEDDLGIKPDNITVLIATSPIPKHPSTDIIEETIQSVRERLPDSEIILMIDGVRDEQSHYKDNYTEYARRLLWKSNHQYEHVYPLLFESHNHQANMAREALRYVRTSKILYMEHDTPLTGDIPFKEIGEVIDSGRANLVRFHYEAQVLDVHKHLMDDSEVINGVPLTRCAQWSQRPHLASTEFYRRIIAEYFPPSSLTMIEDRMYGVLENAWFSRKLAGWNDYKVWMYTPEGDIKRSLNLDGREDDEKFPMKYE